MPDLRKVIEALEHCIQHDDCEGCPYDGVCRNTVHGLDNDILAMLREQEPVKPNKPGTAYKTMWSCGVCSYPISTDWVACPSCGKKIKWEEM